MWKTIIAAISMGLFILDNVTYGQIFGLESKDYPTLVAPPPAPGFSCKGRLPGYYADIEYRCQVWHWCVESDLIYSFVCPIGTVFNQLYRVCDWWYKVNCANSLNHYANNEELYKDSTGNRI